MIIEELWTTSWQAAADEDQDEDLSETHKPRKAWFI